MEAERMSKTIGTSPIQKRRLNTLLEAAVVVPGETWRKNATANKAHAANVTLHSSPEPSLESKKSNASPSPTLLASSSETCVEPYTLPLQERSSPCTTPPRGLSSSAMPQAPYRETITGSKLPSNYPFARKLEWTSGGHPVERTPSTQPHDSDKPKVESDDAANQMQSASARRSRMTVFDCPDAFLDRSPVHIPPFQDALYGNRLSSREYDLSTEEALRRKNMSSPRRSAPKER